MKNQLKKEEIILRVLYKLVLQRAPLCGITIPFAVVYVGGSEYWMVTDNDFPTGEFYLSLYKDLEKYMGGCLFWSPKHNFKLFVNEWPQIMYVTGNSRNCDFTKPEIKRGPFQL